MKLNNNMNMILDIEPSDVKILPLTPLSKELVVIDDKPNSDKDFERSRNNIEKILYKGDRALEGALDLAIASEHPRSYEVVGQLIKTLVDANKDLLALHKQKKDIDGGSVSTPPQNVTNAVFVGNTSDLLKLIKEKRHAE